MPRPPANIRINMKTRGNRNAASMDAIAREATVLPSRGLELGSTICTGGYERTTGRGRGHRYEGRQGWADEMVGYSMAEIVSIPQVGGLHDRCTGAA